MTPAEIMARVARALDALRDEDVNFAEMILDDLLWEFWNGTKREAEQPRRLDDDEERAS